MTREEKEQAGKYVLQMARSLEDGCYQQEMLLKAVHIIDEALEQESNGDNVVSRDVVKEQMIMYGFHAPDMTVTEFVEDLPPVNPIEPTTKNDLGVDCISRDEVCRYVAEFVNHEFSTREEEELIDNIITGIEQMPSVTPQEPCDECEVTFKDDNAVSRLSVRDIIYANAYELEYPDSSSEYVVNRDELIKYLMELPPVYSKMAEPQESEG